jgi:hypothetical protein
MQRRQRLNAEPAKHAEVARPTAAGAAGRERNGSFVSFVPLVSFVVRATYRYMTARGELVEPRAQRLVLRQAQDERVYYSVSAAHELTADRPSHFAAIFSLKVK